MSVFSERLRECRIRQKITQKALSTDLGVSERAYQHYESGEREPSFAVLVAVAQYFLVSTDYLLGLSDDPTKR